MNTVGHSSWTRAVGAALGPAAVDAEHAAVRPRDREALRRSVEILVETRTPWRPGEASANRVGVDAPRGFFDFWPSDLVARIGAGTPLAQIDAALAPEGLRLGAWARRPRTTLGACFADADRGGVSGLGHSLRERVLGATVVDGAGTLLHSGARVVKNVAGFDLTRIHHGARGSLGIVCDLTVRLEARPPARRARFLAGTLSETLARLPERRADAFRESVSELWVPPGTARALGLDGDGGLIVWREGDVDALEDWAQRCGGREFDADPWSVFATVPDESRARIFVSPSHFAEAWTVLTGSAHPGAARGVFDLLGGEVHWSWPNPARAEDVEAAARALAPRGATMWSSGWRGPSRPREDRADAARARSEARLRALFDPHGLLPASPAPVFGGGAGR